MIEVKVGDIVVFDDGEVGTIDRVGRAYNEKGPLVVTWGVGACRPVTRIKRVLSDDA